MTASPQSPEPLLTVHEVAQRLQVSYGTVYSLLREEKLAAVKIGSQWRVEPEKLDDFIQGSRAHTTIGFEGKE